MGKKKILIVALLLLFSAEVLHVDFHHHHHNNKNCSICVFAFNLANGDSGLTVIPQVQNVKTITPTLFFTYHFIQTFVQTINFQRAPPTFSF